MCEFDQSFYNFMEIRISFKPLLYWHMKTLPGRREASNDSGWMSSYHLPKMLLLQAMGGTSELASPHRIVAWQKFLSHFT